MDEQQEVKMLHFEGTCPFLVCLEVGPHDHPICPECGAVRYGNIFCQTCRRHLDAELATIKERQQNG